MERERSAVLYQDLISPTPNKNGVHVACDLGKEDSSGVSDALFRISHTLNHFRSTFLPDFVALGKSKTKNVLWAMHKHYYYYYYY